MRSLPDTLTVMVVGHLLFILASMVVLAVLAGRAGQFRGQDRARYLALLRPALLDDPPERTGSERAGSERDRAGDER